MAPNKRSRNGRSPLVNQRQQITAFFSKQIPNGSSSLSPSLTTPPSAQTKRKKPPLVIGPTTKKLYGAEFVDKRTKLYCPLDKSLREGQVKSFDNILGKHLVQYGGADEESLNLSEEKIDRVAVPVKKKFRRLRKVVEDEDDKIKEPEDLGTRKNGERRDTMELVG